MGANLKIAICQMRVANHKLDNLNHAGELIREAARNSAHLVVLPEIFNVPYQTELMAANAEYFPGPTTTFLSDLARQHKIILVGGSIPERDKDGKVYNSSYVFDEQGELIGKHRKMHLFDIDIPGQIQFQESAVLAAGDRLQIVRQKDLVFAVIICYDIRFPELARLAALEGAQLLIVPAAFNLTTGPAHWELLMRSRAVDNQLFVIAASPARNTETKYQPWGHSLVVDPWGTIMSEAGTAEEIIYAELDLSLIAKVRQEMPLYLHRRTDVYDLHFQPHTE
jgi:predicted amidohydrolase